MDTVLEAMGDLGYILLTILIVWILYGLFTTETWFMVIVCGVLITSPLIILAVKLGGWVIEKSFGSDDP